MSSIGQGATGFVRRWTPLAGAAWTGEAGAAYVARPAPSALVIVTQGRVEIPGGEVIYAAVKREIAKAPAVSYWDLWDMVWYHSDVRKACTAALVESLPRMPEIHALAQSKLVMMGVSVANLAVSGRIQTHATRASFEAAVARPSTL